MIKRKHQRCTLWIWRKYSRSCGSACSSWVFIDKSSMASTRTSVSSLPTPTTPAILIPRWRETVAYLPNVAVKAIDLQEDKVTGHEDEDDDDADRKWETCNVVIETLVLLPPIPNHEHPCFRSSS
ncbi:hypothetical protein SLE2022_254860 [Rubroshorea leprosula]